MENVLRVTVSGVRTDNQEKYPDALKLSQKFMRETPLSKEQLQEVLKAYVLDGKDLKLIKLYIEQGADVNYTYTGGDKLLRMAHQKGNNAAVDLLLEKKATLTLSEEVFFKAIAPEFAKSDAFARAAKTPGTEVPSYVTPPKRTF